MSALRPARPCSYVSHDLGALSQLGDRIAIMYAGALVEVAPVERLFAAPRHPYTRGLIASVPQVTSPPARALMLRGLPPRSGNAARLPLRAALPICRAALSPGRAECGAGRRPPYRGVLGAWRDIEAPAVQPVRAALRS